MRRSGLVAALLLATALLAAARTEDLQGGVSRDGRYAVVLRESSQRQITYEVVMRPSGSILHRVVSNYQPEPDVEAWARHEAASAEVYWSPKSGYVAIDEAPYHHGGEVFLVEIEGGKVRDILLPKEALVAATQCRWERYRIRVAQGWLSDRELSLTLGGYAVRDTLPDGRRISFNRTFEIQVRLERGRAILTSCHETTKS